MYTFRYLLISETGYVTSSPNTNGQWVQPLEVVRISHDEQQGPKCGERHRDLSEAGGSSHVSWSRRTAYYLWNAGRANQSLSDVWTYLLWNIWYTSMILQLRSRTASHGYTFKYHLIVLLAIMSSCARVVSGLRAWLSARCPFLLCSLPRVGSLRQQMWYNTLIWIANLDWVRRKYTCESRNRCN
jgi:hypothetical protein